MLDSGGGVGGRTVAWRLAHNLVTPLTGVRLRERRAMGLICQGVTSTVSATMIQYKESRSHDHVVI